MHSVLAFILLWKRAFCVVNSDLPPLPTTAVPARQRLGLRHLSSQTSSSVLGSSRSPSEIIFLSERVHRTEQLDGVFCRRVFCLLVHSFVQGPGLSARTEPPPKMLHGLEACCTCWSCASSVQVRPDPLEANFLANKRLLVFCRCAAGRTGNAAGMLCGERTFDGLMNRQTAMQVKWLGYLDKLYRQISMQVNWIAYLVNLVGRSDSRMTDDQNRQIVQCRSSESDIGII